MENRSFYNEILTEHNVRPEFKHDMPDADIVLEGVNPSCGDDIFLKLKTDGDTITDGAFVGDGCAISQASADIMLGMVVGKKKEEALQMGKIFMKMIKGDASEEEIDSLEAGDECAGGFYRGTDEGCFYGYLSGCGENRYDIIGRYD